MCIAVAATRISVAVGRTGVAAGHASVATVVSELSYCALQFVPLASESLWTRRNRCRSRCRSSSGRCSPRQSPWSSRDAPADPEGSGALAAERSTVPAGGPSVGASALQFEPPGPELRRSTKQSVAADCRSQTTDHRPPTPESTSRRSGRSRELSLSLAPEPSPRQSRSPTSLPISSFAPPTNTHFAQGVSRAWRRSRGSLKRRATARARLRQPVARLRK